MNRQVVNINDKKLIEKLVSDNINLIYKPTRDFYNSNEMVRVKYEFDELLSVSTIALHKAATKFDESKGYKFSTYAITIIKYSLMGFTRHDKWFYERKKVDGIDKFIVVDRVSTSVTVNDSSQAQGDKEVTLEQSLEDNQDHYKNLEDKILVDYLLNTCVQRDKDIIIDYFYNGFTQKELAKKYKTSQKYISVAINKNLVRFKEILGGELGYVR